MEIPKSFKIFAQTYKVRQVLKIDKQGSWGEHDLNKNLIRIKKDLTQEQKEQVFFHEVFHCMLDNLGYEKLNEDEVFVDTMAKALHQILITGNNGKG